MSVNKYVSSNGKTKWYFSTYYRDWTGKKIRKKKEGFKTKSEAIQAQNTFLNSQKTDSGITFDNLVSSYYEYLTSRIEKTTLATKKQIIDTKILPYFKDLPIAEIDTAKIMRWQTELMKYKNAKTGQPYSQTYLRQIHNQLSTIFNFAVKFYNLSNNPAQRCGSMGKKNAETFDFWTYEEFKQFIETTKEDIQAYTIFNLFFFSGVRLGELLALTLNDFDFYNNKININKSLAVVNGKEIIKDTKTPKSNRAISVPHAIMEMINNYVKHLYNYEPENRLFTVDKSWIHRKMEKYCNIANVRKIKIHELRHSHASHLIALGISPLTISERLGHEDIKTTLNTYSHLYPDKQNEVADILSEYVTCNQ